jgi:hypothetical protein
MKNDQEFGIQVIPRHTKVVIPKNISTDFWHTLLKSRLCECDTMHTSIAELKILSENNIGIIFILHSSGWPDEFWYAVAKDGKVVKEDIVSTSSAKPIKLDGKTFNYDQWYH